MLTIKLKDGYEFEILVGTLANVIRTTYTSDEGLTKLKEKFTNENLSEFSILAGGRIEEIYTNKRLRAVRTEVLTHVATFELEDNTVDNDVETLKVEAAALQAKNTELEAKNAELDATMFSILFDMLPALYEELDSLKAEPSTGSENITE